MKDFIIKPAWGGLGDHLFYSHLPRIAAETRRFDRILISNHSVFRHPDYRTFIWEHNPYVDGFTDRDVRTVIRSAPPPRHNILDQIMLLHGLDDGKRLHEPELYFSPPAKPELSNLTVYDPNFVSTVGRVRQMDVERYFEDENLTPDVMLVPRDKSIPVSTYGGLLTTSSLADYCSVILSSHRFICLTSGGATLAAALKKPVTALYGSGQNPMFHHSRLHTYVNVHRSLPDRAFPQMARASAYYLHVTKARLLQLIIR